MVDVEKIFADHHLGDATFIEVKDVEGQGFNKSVNIHIGPFEVRLRCFAHTPTILFTCCNSSIYLSRNRATNTYSPAPSMLIFLANTNSSLSRLTWVSRSQRPASTSMPLVLPEARFALSWRASVFISSMTSEPSLAAGRARSSLFASRCVDVMNCS